MIRSLEFFQCRRCRDLNNLRINIYDEENVHLVLTGPNGSGKSSVLDAITAALDQSYGEGDRIVLKDDSFELEVHLAEPHPRDSYGICFLARQGRRMMPSPSDGFKPQLSADPVHLTGQNAAEFEQYLLNVKAAAAFGKQEPGKSVVVSSIEEWFVLLEINLRELLLKPELKLEFSIDDFRFRVNSDSNSPRVLFSDLASGHAAALSLFAEILIRARSRGQMEDPSQLTGIVLVDEIETHLHIAMQERILPFLTKTFPNLQFIVATHSPAVIASIDNAVVFDLEKREPVNSAELQGLRYGALMTHHFGIESDYDLDTTICRPPLFAVKCFNEWMSRRIVSRSE